MNTRQRRIKTMQDDKIFHPMLALLNTITKNEGFDSTLATTPRNALTTPLTPLKPSCYPQHGTRGVLLNMQMLL
jgi:hypothetical protein